ncbi:MAG TPA: hypothetical protein P5120_15715 [Spirochaetota bacterium]|nr:hypothetical protein [Spirochaetota bacterium]HRX48968.1 hypothetical protein [Spirochaetota bacterium]
MRIRISILLLLSFILFAAENSLHAAKRRMLGPNFTMSWASSYLAIDSASVKVENDASWTYASATGWFFDYLLNPYISIRSNWFFYPAVINSSPDDMYDRAGEIPLHEIGFSVLRHFNLQPINPWFGAGPFMQFSTINDVNSYIIHAVLSVGFDYEITEETFICPELMCGIGARLLSSDEETVQVNIPTGKDFTSSGIVVFFKLGVGRTF